MAKPKITPRERKVLNLVPLSSKGGNQYANLIPTVQDLSDELSELNELLFLRALSTKAVDDEQLDEAVDTIGRLFRKVVTADVLNRKDVVSIDLSTGEVKEAVKATVKKR